MRSAKKRRLFPGGWIRRVAAFAMAAVLTAGSLPFDSLAAEGDADAGIASNSVSYEVIDLGEDRLEVTNTDGVMTLSQSAASGSMADSNVSYLVFPATDDEGTLSLKLKVKSYNFGKGSGVFVGAFMPDNEAGSRYFMSMGFRNPDQETTNSLSPYWWKAPSDTKPVIIGNGNPKTTVQLDTEYTVNLSWDAAGQMVITVPELSAAGVESAKTFKPADCHPDLYDHEGDDGSQYTAERRFGIAIVGVVAEITNMVYCDSAGEELFNQNNVTDEGGDGTEGGGNEGGDGTEADPNEPNGFLAAQAKEGITYTFDFSKWDEPIYDLPQDVTDEEAAKTAKAPLKSGTVGLVTVNAGNQAKYENDHGTSNAMDIDIAVAGTVKISVCGCQYSGEKTYTMTSATGTVMPGLQTENVQHCNDALDFYYKGDAGSVNFTSTGGYLHKIIVTPIAESDIPDFGGGEEGDPNEPNGFLAARAKEGITYTFDFSKWDEPIYDLPEGVTDEEAAKTAKAPLKSGTVGLVTVNAGNQAKYENDHGTSNSMDIDIAVAGTVKISVCGCQYSGEKTYTMTSATGTVMPAAQTVNVQHCNDAMDFYYKGDAGSVNFTSTGGYLHKIIVTPIAESDIPDFGGGEEGDPNEPNGFLAARAKEGITYTFDFSKWDEPIYDLPEGVTDEEAAKTAKAPLKSGTVGLVSVNAGNQAKYENDHGTSNSMDIDIAVAGTVKISVCGCQYSGEKTYTMTSATGTVMPAAQTVNVQHCNDAMDFYYKGDAGSVNFTSTGGYLHKIIVTPIAESDIPDFGGGEEPDPMSPDGFVAPAPVREITYTFNFADPTAKIYDLNGAPTAAQGTAMKDAGLVTVNSNNQAKYHNDHGTNGAMDVQIAVAGDCKVNIMACQFTGDTDTFTVSSATGTVSDPATQNAKVEKDKDLVTYTYTGGEGSIRLVSTGGYIHAIEIVPVIRRENRKIEVWDFAEVQMDNSAVYHNNITSGFWKQSGLIGSGGTGSNAAIEFNVSNGKTVTIGDLTMVYENGDRLYGGVTGTTFAPYSTMSYEDGYTADGLWYCNGSGGAGRRYVTIKYMEAGDKVVLYMGSHTIENDLVHFQYQGGDATQDDTAEIGYKEGRKYEFIAKYDGTYKIYAGNSSNVKPFWHRIMVLPGARVSGSVDLASTGITGYGLKFVNNATEDEIMAEVAEDGTFTVSLTPGYEYTAILTGVVGYGLTAESKTVTVPDSAAVEGMSNVKVVVEGKDVQKFSGTFTGFGDDVDMTAVKVVLVAASDSQRENVAFKLAADGKFETYVESGISYTITMEGVNDYEIDGNTEVLLTAAEEREVKVAKKAVYQVAGSFRGLEGDASVTSLKFVNMEDDCEYPAVVEGGSYSVSLRNGTYEVEATVSAGGYSTISHVVVNDRAVDRDLLFVSNAKVTAIPFVSDIYVGYPGKDNNYNTVRDAVRACEAMRLSNANDRITVHIAPGVYREQVIINVPKVTFTNDEPDREVKLTWYYGVGYEYYSIGSDGYYSEAAAFDKFDKGSAQKWGVAFYIKSGATEFRAENITFESSFNKYVTEEEIADGVAPGGGDAKNYDRTSPTADVTSKEGTERAAALAVEGNRSEFYHCRLLSSQDTLYTGNNINGYFRNCYIEGNTDYIFGGGDFVYDGCELNFFGYSDKESGGYITAAADGSIHGYVFRNCYITGNENMKVGAGDLGRPWRATATVSFLNTKLEYADIILPRGWNSMSGNLPENANYAEYNTTAANGETVDFSERAVSVSTVNPVPDVSVVFNGWTPAYYQADTDNVALARELAVSAPNEDKLAVGDVLTADLSLGDNEYNNVSVIRWYRVAADGTETLVKSGVAQFDRSYTVAAEDKGCHIKVTVLPETVSGYTAAEQTATHAAVVGGAATGEPTPEPTSKPTAEPTSKPTAEPTSEPTAEPTSKPTPEPTSKPTAEPTSEPTAEPTSKPTAEPTSEPTAEPTSKPTPEPTSKPTSEPTAEPTSKPTAEPTSEPTAEPTSKPTPEPTAEPTSEPSPTSVPDTKPIEDLIANAMQKDDVDAIVNEIVAGVEIGNLSGAMQSNENVFKQIAELDQRVKEDKDIHVDIEVADEAGAEVDNAAMGIVGAAINAENGEAVLKVSNAEQTVTIEDEKLTENVQLDIRLTSRGEEIRELRIPVTITIPIPRSLLGDRIETLVLLHYAADGSCEKVNFRMNADNTVTFTVTHFSTFVFAKEGAAPDPGVTPGPEDNPSSEPDDVDESDDGGGMTQTSAVIVTQAVNTGDSLPVVHLSVMIVMLLLMMAAVSVYFKKDGKDLN